MSKRRLEVELIGDARNLKRALGEATGSLNKFHNSIGSRLKSAAMFSVASAGIAGIGGAIVGVVKAGADFEKQMSALQAVSSASGKQMDLFKKQAIDAGIKTKFSARQAAEAQTELAKGGLSVAQIMSGGLKSSLALAAAGNLELADAAGITANALNLFGLRGDDAVKVADAMATAANATTADVSDFGMALAQGGSVAKSAGLSFTDTMVALEALAASGIKNADAGTSLKTSLIQLLKPTQKQADLADSLGLKFTTQAGKMKSLSDMSAMLRDKLGGMTKAQRTAVLAQIAGTDGVRTLTSLYDAGPAKLEKFRKGLEQQGSAARTAATMQDNLAGRVENLKGTVETLAIKLFEKVKPALDTVVVALSVFAQGILTGQGVGGKFAAIISGAFSRVVGAAKGIVGAIRDVVTGFRDGKTWAVALVAGMAGFAAAAAVIKIVTTATKVWTAAQIALDVAMAANPFVLAAAAIVGLGAALVIAYKKSEKFRDIVDGAFSAVRKAADSIGRVLKPIAETVFPAILAVAKRVFPGLKQIVQGALRVVTGIVKVFSSILKGDFRGAWEGVKQIFSGALKINIGIVRAATAPMREAVSRIATAMVKVLHDLGQRFYELGVNLIKGLVSGVLSMGRAVADAVAGVATGAVDKAKGLLGIHSPSTVFAGIGKNVMEGFIGGILSNRDRVNAGLTKALVFPLDAAIAALNAKKAAIQAVWDKLDKIAEKSRLVADIAKAKGGVASATKGVATAKRNAKVNAQMKASGVTGTGGSVASTILAVGKKMGASGKQMLAAIMTGIVESGLKNLNFGDADSLGWRQERTSIYGKKHATSVVLSAQDFFREAMAHDRGQSAGELAADVQRPAAQYRGRYAQVIAQAKAILGRTSGGRSSGAGGGSGGESGTSVKSALSTLSGSRGDLKAARQALADFNKEAQRAQVLAKIDAKITGLERLKAWKNALAEIRSEIGDRLSGAVDKFRNNWENTTGKAIDKANAAILQSFDDNVSGILQGFDRASAGALAAFDKVTAQMVKDSPAAKALAAMQAEDVAKQIADEDKANAKALADAQGMGGFQGFGDYGPGSQFYETKKAAIDAAQAAIDATARARSEAALQLQVDAETTAIEDQRATDRTTLEDQQASKRLEIERFWAGERTKLEESQAVARQTRMDDEAEAFRKVEAKKFKALEKSLGNQTISYADFVKAVNKELGNIGADLYNPNSDIEFTVTAGPRPGGPSGHQAGSGGRDKGGHAVPSHAQGGMVVRRVGELGPEDVYLPTGSRVMQASQSKGGGSGVYIDMRGARVGSHKAAEVMANRLAYRVQFG
jgi:TP901 family phage tail tape measure protein